MITGTKVSDTFECGRWNAECGKYENQTSSELLFRIPHSDFPIR
jgi:hypothetical protein